MGGGRIFPALIFVHSTRPDPTIGSSDREIIGHIYPGAISDIASLKEHRQSYSKPLTSWSKFDATRVQMQNLQYSAGLIFIVFNRSWLDGKTVEVVWACPTNNEIVRIEIWDGSYDRKSFTDFPDGASRATKGAGNLQTLANRTDTFGEYTLSAVAALGDGTETDCTLFIQELSGHLSGNVVLRVDRVTIKDAGVPVFEHHFLSRVIMEVTGTYNDYGYVAK